MTARPLPADLPPLTIRGLASLIHRANPACTGQPELFFGPDIFEDEPVAEHAARVQSARKVCAACPVRLACLAGVLPLAVVELGKALARGARLREPKGG